MTARAKKKPTPPPELVVHEDDFEQGSDEWFAARAGKITASKLACVPRAGGKDSTESRTRDQYMRTLAGELITGNPDPVDYRNWHMERGKAMEPEARADYAFRRRVEVRQVALGVRRCPWGELGASPDGLIGAIGAVEFKSVMPSRLIEFWERDRTQPPGEFLWQCHGIIRVFNLQYCDLILFWPGIAPLEYRVERDELLMRRMDDACQQFQSELNDLVERMRRRAAR